MISLLIDPSEVDAGYPEVRVSELALDDDQRDTLVGHLDRARLAQLVRSEDGGRQRPLRDGAGWPEPRMPTRVVRPLAHRPRRAERRRHRDSNLEPCVELLQSPLDAPAPAGDGELKARLELQPAAPI